MADPRRGTLSFVTQKFFCFGAINNRRNMVLFLLPEHEGCLYGPRAPYIISRYGAPGVL